MRGRRESRRVGRRERSGRERNKIVDLPCRRSDRTAWLERSGFPQDLPKALLQFSRQLNASLQVRKKIERRFVNGICLQKIIVRRETRKALNRAAAPVKTKIRGAQGHPQPEGHTQQQGSCPWGPRPNGPQHLWPRRRAEPSPQRFGGKHPPEESRR